MLEPEARWLSSRLSTLGPEHAPVLNVGSSSEAFRTRVQPWIDDLLFRPLRERGLRVVHQDLAEQPGVDVAGDLLAPEVTDAILALGVRTVMCSNVIEHVRDRRAFASALSALVPSGGRLLVTVPRAFPYHPDPIDTGFRPSVHEIAQLFPRLQLVRGEIVRCGRLHDLVLQNPRRLVEKVCETVRPSAPSPDDAPPQASAARRRARSAELLRWLPWTLLPFQTTCVDLRSP